MQVRRKTTRKGQGTHAYLKHAYKAKPVDLKKKTIEYCIYLTVKLTGLFGTYPIVKHQGSDKPAKVQTHQSLCCLHAHSDVGVG